MSTILVTGASGFVGSYAVPALLAAGHRIEALVRTPEAGQLVLDRLPASDRAKVGLRTGDVTRPGSLPAAMDGVDGVLHLAAIPRDRKGGEELRLVNTEGTRAVVVAMQATGVKRLVHMGAMGVADDPTPALRELEGEGGGAGRDLEPRLDHAQAVAPVRPRRWVLQHHRGPRPPVARHRPDPGQGQEPVPADQRRGCRDGRRAIVRRRRHDRCDAGAGRTALLDVPRDHVRGADRRSASKRAILPMPVPLIRLVAGMSETIGLPFPVATDQLRQLKLDNIGPLGVIESRFGFQPRPMEGALGYLKLKPKDQTERLLS